MELLLWVYSSAKVCRKSVWRFLELFFYIVPSSLVTALQILVISSPSTDFGLCLLSVIGMHYLHFLCLYLGLESASRQKSRAMVGHTLFVPLLIGNTVL